MTSYRVIMGEEHVAYIDAVVQALRDATDPELAGCHITVRGPVVEGIRTTSIEGDRDGPGEVVFGIVLDTIDRERERRK